METQTVMAAGYPLATGGCARPMLATLRISGLSARAATAATTTPAPRMASAPASLSKNSPVKRPAKVKRLRRVNQWNNIGRLVRQNQSSNGGINLVCLTEQTEYIANRI